MIFLSMVLSLQNAEAGRNRRLVQTPYWHIIVD
jgi:hypothetical protein